MIFSHRSQFLTISFFFLLYSTRILCDSIYSTSSRVFYGKEDNGLVVSVEGINYLRTLFLLIDTNKKYKIFPLLDNNNSSTVLFLAVINVIF